jgi:hypothetical protein
MPSSKIYLGRSKACGATYLEKHEWQCGWYWAFGYIGNNNCHMHIESIINHPEAYSPNWTNVGEQFTETWLTQNQWWILRDLFIQAYALKKAAETYQYGGHQICQAAPYRIINAERAKEINADLAKLLDNIWDVIKEWKAACPS